MLRNIGFGFLLLIVILSIFLRFNKVSTNFIFGADQAEDIYKTIDIHNAIKSRDFDKLPLIGEPGTSTIEEQSSYKVYSGVFFLYLVLIPAIASNFDPAKLVFCFSVANLIGVLLIYVVGKKLVSARAGVVAAFLYSTNYYMNVYSRAIWTPSLVPILVLLALYLFVLVIKEEKNRYWPWYYFTISAISQIHDSGYYYLILFLLLTLLIKSKKPIGWLNKTISVLAFLAPLLPTIIYEVKTKFLLFPTIFAEFNLKSGGYNPLNLLKETFVKLWEFFVSTILPLCFDSYYKSVYGFWYSPLLLGITVLIIISIIIRFNFTQSAGLWDKIFRIFFISFLFIPIFSKIYYSDNYFGLYPLFGTTFSTIGAMPFVFLMIGSSLDTFIKRRKLYGFIGIVFLVYIAAINIRSVYVYILQNGDMKYDYGNKTHMVDVIRDNAKGENYNFIYDDPNSYAEGIEFFYLLSHGGLRYPVSYNGLTTLEKIFHKYDFTEGVSDITYVVSGKPKWDLYENSSWVRLAESGWYRLYRNVPDFD